MLKMASNYIKSDPKLLSVGILGYTGETGKSLTREILKSDIFKSTTLIGRRNVEYSEEFMKNGQQVQVDFDNIEHEKYNDVFKQDVIYCCLGTTRGKSGVEGFKKVDLDYVVNSAKMAKKNGCKQFHLVSSSGADSNSILLYPQVKGQSEEEIRKLEFEQAFVYRPKLIMVNREESRVGESIIRFCFRPLAYMAPQLATTPVEFISNSMIAKTLFKKEGDQSFQIVDNSEIFQFSDLYCKNLVKQ